MCYRACIRRLEASGDAAGLLLCCTTVRHAVVLVVMRRALGRRVLRPRANSSPTANGPARTTAPPASHVVARKLHLCILIVLLVLQSFFPILPDLQLCSSALLQPPSSRGGLAYTASPRPPPIPQPTSTPYPSFWPSKLFGIPIASTATRGHHIHQSCIRFMICIT